MARFILAGILLLGYGEHTAALAVSGWQDPNHNVTGPALEKRIGMAVIPTKLNTIYLDGNPRKARTADLGFDFQIASGLWALCPTTILKVEDCLVGSCYDGFLCSKGCGQTDRTSLASISCTKSDKTFCSTAFLTHQTAMTPVSNYACAADVSEDDYMGFTTEPPLEDVTTSTSTTAPAPTNLEPTVARNPTQTSFASSTEPPSSRSTSGPAAGADTKSNSTGAENNAAAASNSAAAGNTGASSNTAAIIGGVVGCVALIGGFGLAIVLLLRRNKKAKAASASSSTLQGDGSSFDGKPELEAYERERPELFGQSVAEMSARGPAAYDTSSYRPNYPPMTPVELPTARGSWI